MERGHTGIAAMALMACMAMACGASKTSVDSPEATQLQEAGQGFSTGVVTTDHVAEGCAVLVQVDGVKNVFLIPIGMEDRFKRDGLKLRFKYRPSRASIGECRKGQAAILEEITVAPAKTGQVMEVK